MWAIDTEGSSSMVDMLKMLDAPPASSSPYSRSIL
jgi:hypothetical protein